MVISEAQGRLPGIQPIAIIDIGSNSVRIVIYEGLLRAPTVLFNEKISCGLGKGVALTGQMDQTAVDRALATLKRFRLLAKQAGVTHIHALATAAVREAADGPDFIKQAERILGIQLQVLSGREEAKFAAYGVISGTYMVDGIVGDMGGGSLELVDIKSNDIGKGITLPLGGLRLQESSGNDLDKAKAIAAQQIANVGFLPDGKKRNFYAVGGTWRAIGKLYMELTDYPLQMMQGYELSYDDIMAFLKRVIAHEDFGKENYYAISKNRRGLLPYGAVTMAELLKIIKPKSVIFSAQGVREGFLFSLLEPKQAKLDALIEGAKAMAVLRARSPLHAQELADWTGNVFPLFGIEESAESARYRQAACFLADISWRAHPDYRGLQALNIIANGAFASVSHAGRAYIALSNYYRYEGLYDDGLSHTLAQVATAEFQRRAKLLGGLFRILYLFSASMHGILPDIEMVRAPAKDAADLYLLVPKKYSDMIGERLAGRVQQIHRIFDKQIDIKLI